MSSRLTRCFYVPPRPGATLPGPSRRIVVEPLEQPWPAEPLRPEPPERPGETEEPPAAPLPERDPEPLPVT